MIYALVMGALRGRGWMTLEEVVRRAGLPRVATYNALTELVGEGKVFVQVSHRAGGAVLVWTDEP